MWYTRVSFHSFSLSTREQSEGDQKHFFVVNSNFVFRHRFRKTFVFIPFYRPRHGLNNNFSFSVRIRVERRRATTRPLPLGTRYWTMLEL